MSPKPMIGQHDDRAFYHRRRWEHSETTSASWRGGERCFRLFAKFVPYRKSCTHDQARQPSNPFSRLWNTIVGAVPKIADIVEITNAVMKLVGVG